MKIDNYLIKNNDPDVGAEQKSGISNDENRKLEKTQFRPIELRDLAMIRQNKTHAFRAIAKSIDINALKNNRISIDDSDSPIVKQAHNTTLPSNQPCSADGVTQPPVENQLKWATPSDPTSTVFYESRKCKTNSAENFKENCIRLPIYKSGITQGADEKNLFHQIERWYKRINIGEISDEQFNICDGEEFIRKKNQRTTKIHREFEIDSMRRGKGAYDFNMGSAEAVSAIVSNIKKCRGS